MIERIRESKKFISEISFKNVRESRKFIRVKYRAKMLICKFSVQKYLKCFLLTNPMHSNTSKLSDLCI